MLSLNIKKTNFIIFRNENKHVNYANLQIKINKIVIDQVDKTKFLGVIINEILKWNNHIKIITSKVSKNISIMLTIRRIVLAEIVFTLYHTLIETYLNYCNIICGFDWRLYNLPRKSL